MYRRGKLSDIFEDFIVFRELNPVNKNLPQFEELKRKLSLKKLPRKKDLEYVDALSYIFSAIGEFKKIFYIGDTLMSDLGVIKNFALSSRFQTYGIITREGELNGFEDREEFILNGSWKNIFKAFEFAEEHCFKIDNGTVFIIDIDKTAVGARGRNDVAIDRARMDAIFSLASEIFGSINREKFFDVYNAVNKKEFFYITEDNQDIVSILSFLVYDGAVSLNVLRRHEFSDAFSLLNASHTENPLLEEKVREVLRNIKNGNPTAFVEFRKMEFEKTIARMDFLRDNIDLKTLLVEEILITGEVYDLALTAKKRGALVFGVSDKPMYSTEPQDGTNLPPIYEKVMKIYSDGNE